MCGINGVWTFGGRQIYLPELAQFTDSLAHRGPDGAGNYIDADAALGLGHRRLSILDLSDHGAQPMSDTPSGGRYWITYNGEVYNFVELRRDLEAGGHRFTSDTDTEVVLKAYIEWGEDCQLKFNGMWAFAIWDSADKTLFLSRDRFGIKPLFYYFDGETFAFASELKAFRHMTRLHTPFNKPHIASCIGIHQNLEYALQTKLHNVYGLRGGYCLSVDAAREVRTRRWWNTLDHLVDVPRRFDEQVEAFRELFFDSCSLRTRSDAAIGFTLSGGMDSASVVAASSQLLQAHQQTRAANNWRNTFTASFEHRGRDETDLALAVAKKVGLAPQTFMMDFTQLIEDVADTVYHYENVTRIPVQHRSIYGKLRENNVYVALEGHGGDELLAGYPFHHRFWVETLLTRPSNPRKLAAALNAFLNLTSRGRKRGLRRDARRVLELMRRHLPSWKPDTRPFELQPFAWLNGVTSVDWLKQDRSDLSEMATDWNADREQHKHLDALNQHLHYDVHHGFLVHILHVHERMSMAHGIEVRTPFLDWRLVCFAMSLQDTSKVRDGYSKAVLRHAMRDLLPESVLYRKDKRGFNNSVRDYAYFEPLVREVIHDRAFLNADIWDGAAVRDRFEMYYNGGKQPDDLALLYRAVMMHLLMQRFDEVSVP